MTTRVWKAIFVAIFSLLILAYAVQNVFNLSGGMYSSFAYVLSQAEHQAYPESFFPPITSAALIWVILLSVLILEFIAGALAGYGAWKMWQYREASATDYNMAKKQAFNGLGVAVIVWFLMFGAFGAAVFQMWQTQIGSSSFNGAFQLTVYALLLFGLLNMSDND